MIMSMTGFGKREIHNNDISISIEIKSINSRYLEVNHKIPRLFSEDEESILGAIRKKLIRGKVILNMNYTFLNDKFNKVKLNDDKVNQYLDIVKSLSSDQSISCDLSVDKLLSLPDVLSTNMTSSNVSYKRVLVKSLNLFDNSSQNFLVSFLFF